MSEKLAMRIRSGQGERARKVQECSVLPSGPATLQGQDMMLRKSVQHISLEAVDEGKYAAIYFRWAKEEKNQQRGRGEGAWRNDWRIGSSRSKLRRESATQKELVPGSCRNKASVK